MNYWQQWRRRREKRYQIIYKRGPSTLALIFAGMALSLWAIFAIFSSYPVFLYLYYTVVPGTTELLSKSLQRSSEKFVAEAKAPVVVPEAEPIVTITRDPSLPEGHYLTIPKIGVDTMIREASNDKYEEALRLGVWRVGEFGDPEKIEDGLPAQAGRPIILAAHRFGYLEWTQTYREKNSFYKLPELSGGDQIAIVWNQHRYIYRVTKIEEGSEITDYSSDLILYTCKFLVSPIRIVVYAELVK